MDIMIRFDQRSFDVQGTERVFKKIVQPGQNSLRLVDKDGIPLRGPNTQALSRLHSTYVLSPRGVPTRKSTHAYSGQLTQSKMQSLVNSLETSSQEMASYTSMHSYGNGLSSAGSSRHYIPANLTPKKRAFGSGPPQSMKSGTAKSASSRQTSRYLTSAPSREGMEEIDKEQSNDSPQGKRLEKEWSALSQCRALKRSSEIVSHRVDRMYFMTGNKLQLQSKYHVEEDELKNLRELSQARAVSRASREEMRERARSLMKKREYDENERLDNIERKLSNIEHRLGHIEEQTEENIKERHGGPLSVHINNRVETISRSSSESGIHEADDHDEEDLALGKDNESIHSAGSHQDVVPERPVSRVEIRSKQVPNNKDVSSGIKVWDIMKHDKAATGTTETMMKLFEVYPNVHARARYAWEKNEFETANELTLGVPRKVRHAKMKSPRKHVKKKLGFEQELTGVAITRDCKVCKCEARARQKENSVYVPRDTRSDHLKQSFPVRKPSIKIMLKHQPPVECECRLDPWKMRGRTPPLAVTGTQVPLCDRDITYAAG